MSGALLDEQMAELVRKEKLGSDEARLKLPGILERACAGAELQWPAGRERMKSWLWPTGDESHATRAANTRRGSQVSTEPRNQLL